MKPVFARFSALAVVLLVGWLAAACSTGGSPPSQDVQFPSPAAATGPYTLVHFTASW